MINQQYLQFLQGQLAQFATQDNFESIIFTAFGDRVDLLLLQDLRQQWLAGDFSVIPEIQVLEHGELGSANGAYAAELDKIFVSADFLATAGERSIGAVLLEEVGHRIDRLLNGDVDSPGDEGEIFSRLVNKENLSSMVLSELTIQNDHDIIIFDNLAITVEKSYITGDSGNDRLIGNILESNTIYGGAAGADFIVGGNEKDYLSGGNPFGVFYDTENDTIYGGGGNDTIYSGNGSDSLFGEEGDDIITDGAYSTADRFTKRIDNDSIDGGAGNDKITDVSPYWLEGKNSLYGGDGNDTIETNNGSYVNGGFGNDVISIKYLTKNRIYDASYILAGRYYPLTIYEEKYTEINGAEGTDTLTIDYSNANSQEFTDSLNLHITSVGGTTPVADGYIIDGNGIRFEGIEVLELSGISNSNKSLKKFVDASSSQFVNSYFGGDNDSTYLGGSGNDSLVGGDGNDSFVGGSGNDYLGFIGLYSYGAGNDSLSGGFGMDTIVGGDGNDLLIGGDDNDRLYGNEQSFYERFRSNVDSLNDKDTLEGGDGNDYLVGGAGDDSLIGGNGNDTLDGDGIYDAYFVRKGLFGVVGKDFLDGGSGDDVLFDTIGGGNLLYGGDGQDTLAGGLGTDLDGGTGNDLYKLLLNQQTLDSVDFTFNADGSGVGNGNTHFLNIEGLSFKGGRGDDAIDASATTYFNGIENVYNNWNELFGYGGNDRIFTGTSFDLLDGGDGNDLLSAGGGQDTINGGAGANTLEGGTGNDKYIVINSSGGTIINDVSGIDTIQLSASINITTSLSRSGTSLVIDLNGDNQFDGANDLTILNFFDYSGSAGNGFIENIRNLVGAAIIDRFANDSIVGSSNDDNYFGGIGNDTIDGGAGNDYLIGGTGTDSLIGGAGNDILDGSGDTTSADKFAGGTGNDVYGVYSPNTIVVENDQEGIDTVWTIVDNYTLSPNVENLYLVGNLTGNGNIGNNIIVGYGADNHIINGLGGDDYLIGGSGKDTLNGGDGDDYLNGRAGVDNLQGGAGNDVLDGSNGDNSIDTFAGGTGDDAYGVYNTDTVIIENVGEGNDTVWTAVDYTLAANVENLYLVGNLTGNGNGGNNVIVGYSTGIYAADIHIINGFGGDDYLVGGSANDTIYSAPHCQDKKL